MRCTLLAERFKLSDAQGTAYNSDVCALVLTKPGKTGPHLRPQGTMPTAAQWGGQKLRLHLRNSRRFLAVPL